MNKRFWVSVLAACGLTVTSFAAPKTANNFRTAINEVDLDGEMLQFQDLEFVEPLINQKVPALIKMATEGNAQAPLINQAVKSVLKLINIGALNGVASSSKEVAPGIYRFKAFVLADMNAKSIFIDPTQKNVPLTWKTLPADTRFAFKGNININHIWSMIYAEIKNNPNQDIRQLVGMIEGLKAQGIDVNALAAAISGDIEILITGSSLQDVAGKVVIPDNNGAVSALLKQNLPPQPGTNTAVIPTPIGINIQVIYDNGKITAVSNPKLLRPAVNQLASVPHFRKYATILPGEGNGYLVVDIPQEVLNLIKANIADEPEIVQIFDMFIKPMSLVAVSRVERTGAKNIIASNFSIAQLQVTLPFSIPMATVLPAITSARGKAKQIGCVNNMKQVSTACMMYSCDYNDQLPPNLNSLIKGKYVTEDICADVILLLPNVKMSSVAAPTNTPLAICDRTTHPEKTVCVAFVDGHVESIAVNEDADEKAVVQQLISQKKIPRNLAAIMLKQLECED